MYVENIKSMFHENYLHKCFLMMLALLIKTGADPWGMGVPFPPTCHFPNEKNKIEIMVIISPYCGTHN